jgi:hypothetical protein
MHGFFPIDDDRRGDRTTVSAPRRAGVRVPRRTPLRAACRPAAPFAVRR